MVGQGGAITELIWPPPRADYLQYDVFEGPLRSPQGVPVHHRHSAQGLRQAILLHLPCWVRHPCPAQSPVFLLQFLCCDRHPYQVRMIAPTSP
eukprot:c30531_g1_i1 orf=3-278(-)